MLMKENAFKAILESPEVTDNQDDTQNISAFEENRTEEVPLEEHDQNRQDDDFSEFGFHDPFFKNLTSNVLAESKYYNLIY